MPHGTSQVVGLIEIDAASQPHHDHPLRSSDYPLHPLPQAGARASIARRSLSSPPIAEIVRADLVQINEDLHMELAAIVARVAVIRARKAEK